MSTRPTSASAESGDTFLALGVDDQDGAIHRQQVRDHSANPFPGAGRRKGEQMGGTIIAQESPGAGIASDQQAVTALVLLQLLTAGEAGGAVTVAGQPEEVIGPGDQGRVSAGLAALRAAAAKDREAGRPREDFRERLARVVGRSEDRDDTPKLGGRNYPRERLKEIMEKDAGRDGQAAVHKLDGHSDPELGNEVGREEPKPSVNERLKDVLNKPRE